MNDKETRSGERRRSRQSIRLGVNYYTSRQDVHIHVNAIPKEGIDGDEQRTTARGRIASTSIHL